MNTEKQQTHATLDFETASCEPLQSGAAMSSYEAQSTMVRSECSGAIPYRLRNGFLEVLLITSRATMQWIIPKGHIEKGSSHVDTATLEAFEEAGVVGTVNPGCAGSYVHCNGRELQHVHVYLLAVETTLPHWPERLQRQRLWSPFEYAAERVGEGELRRIILDLPKKL